MFEKNKLIHIPQVELERASNVCLTLNTRIKRSEVL